MKDLKLKPNTTYGFSDEDYEFIIELTKVGYVNILSHQVCLIALKGYSDGIVFDFKDGGGNLGPSCEGLKLPENWVIERISGCDQFLKITFWVKK